MIDRLKPYPKYKDSGVPWLGEVPEHWEVTPGRACLREVNRPNAGLIETTVLSLSYGRIVIKPEHKLHGLVPGSFETYQVVEPGDIICRPTDLQNDQTSLRFGLSKDRGIITSAYICLRTAGCLQGVFGYLLLHMYDLKKIFYALGSGLRQNLDWRDFKSLPCLLPPLPEQTAIVRFLEWADHRIRQVIRARRRQIKLLEEYKQALINQGVSGKIDVRTGKPYPIYKDSGVEWLGKVPAHWEVKSVKRHYEIQLGKMLQSVSKTEKEVLVPYLKAIHVQWSGLNTDDLPMMWASLEELAQYSVKPGDLLVCEGGEGGRCAIVRDVQGTVIIQNALHRVRPREKASNEYLRYCMKSIANIGWFDVLNDKATIAHFTREKFAALEIPVPPLPEQTAIAKYIDERTAKIDTAIAATHREIDLLEEFRTRLIADVVTGKLDVREAAAKLPDKAPGEKTLEGDKVESATGDSVVSGKHVDPTQEEINGG